MNHLLRKKISLLFLLSAFVLLLASPLPVSAQSAGYDLLQTGSGASVDLGSLGNVPLQGVPIQTSLGNTDTIMHRTQDTVGGGKTPVEVTALFMKSKSSITYNNQPVDVYVTVNNSGGKIATSVLPQPDSTSSSGTVTVNSGGTFDSSITVTADLIFVKAGTSVTNSANYVPLLSLPQVPPGALRLLPDTHRQAAFPPAVFIPRRCTTARIQWFPASATLAV